MSTGYYLMAGSSVVDEFDINSSGELSFHNEMRNFSLTLSDEGRVAFSFVCEYAMYPDEDAPPVFTECSNQVREEIESKLYAYYE